MIDASVGPAGLFPLRRQRRLIDGLIHRIESSRQLQRELVARQASQASQDDLRWSQQRDAMMTQCRASRREMLARWDAREEELIRVYESDTITHRRELNRLAVIFRRRLSDETKTIERKVESRRQAVTQQYENRKHLPGQTKRKDIQRIDEALGPINQQLEELRSLTIARLDQLPEVDDAVGLNQPGQPSQLNQPGQPGQVGQPGQLGRPGDETDPSLAVPKPKSVSEAIESIAVLQQSIRDVVAQMHSGTASKIVDHHYLPIAVAALVMAWAAAAYFFAPDPPWIWMAAGLIPCGLVGFAAYLVLLWPLKQATRKIYPRGERISRAAESCAAIGRTFASRQAADTTTELVSQRDSHLTAATRWHDEQIAELTQRLNDEQTQMRRKLQTLVETTEKSFASKFALVGSQMRTQADAVAQSITSTIAQTDQTIVEERQRIETERQLELERLAKRLKAGVDQGLHRIETTDAEVNSRYPSWTQVIAPESTSTAQTVDFLPLGTLRIDSRLQAVLSAPEPESDHTHNLLNGEYGGQESSSEAGDRHFLPVTLHRRVHSCLVIHTTTAAMDAAIELAHQTLWRLLSGAMPGRAKLTLIDPLGRGQHFTAFMALADHDPAIVGHRVWTTDQKIEARLAELAHHVEDVLQSSLRDQFERIEDYNRHAGSMAEPYRAVAAVGFPNGLSREGFGHLRALVESGLRCGIFTILIVDDANPWPTDMPLPSGEKVLSLRVHDERTWSVMHDGLDDLPMIPMPVPPPSMRPALVERIGKEAVAASRVEIPLAGILSSESSGKGSTDDDISIVVGSRGANRTQSVQLGEGVRQHVLIAGKTGSGKSTLLHDIITSGAAPLHARPTPLLFVGL